MFTQVLFLLRFMTCSHWSSACHLSGSLLVWEARIVLSLNCNGWNCIVLHVASCVGVAYFFLIHIHRFGNLWDRFFSIETCQETLSFSVPLPLPPLHTVYEIYTYTHTFTTAFRTLYFSLLFVFGSKVNRLLWYNLHFSRLSHNSNLGMNRSPLHFSRIIHHSLTITSLDPLQRMLWRLRLNK